MSAVILTRGILVVAGLLACIKSAALTGYWPIAGATGLAASGPAVPGLLLPGNAPRGIPAPVDARALGGAAGLQLSPISTAYAAGTMDPPPIAVPRRPRAPPSPARPASSTTSGGIPSIAPRVDMGSSSTVGLAEARPEALAMALRDRRRELDEREESIATREAVVAAAEMQLQERLAALSGLQARLEASEKAAQDRESAHWGSLARLYETMRPREAAAVFNEMELPILSQIVSRMREQKAAPVFGAMDPDRVRALTAELARIRAARPLL